MVVKDLHTTHENGQQVVCGLDLWPRQALIHDWLAIHSAGGRKDVSHKRSVETEAVT